MSVALTILLIAFCVQGLVKFAVGFLVPYRRRINRIATYYRRDGRIISIYDSVTLAMIVVLVVLLFVTGVHGLSFITGLIVGMLLIQIFFHRFDKPLPPEQAPPESPAPPRKLMSYAIQADPGLAWREIILMTAMLSGLSTNSSASSWTRGQPRAGLHAEHGVSVSVPAGSRIRRGQLMRYMCNTVRRQPFWVHM